MGIVTDVLIGLGILCSALVAGLFAVGGVFAMGAILMSDACDDEEEDCNRLRECEGMAAGLRARNDADKD